MMYRLIMCIAAIGLAHEAAAEEFGAFHLRGSDDYDVAGPASRAGCDLGPLSGSAHILGGGGAVVVCSGHGPLVRPTQGPKARAEPAVAPPRVHLERGPNETAEPTVAPPDVHLEHGPKETAEPTVAPPDVHSEQGPKETAEPTGALDLAKFKRHDVIPDAAFAWHPTRGPAPSYPPVFKVPIAPAPPKPFWTGFYVGPHLGAGAGAASFADPFGSSIFGDKVITPGFLAGGQIGYNWQLTRSNWVLGVEADLSLLDSEGTNTCLAFSGLFVSATCRAQPDVMGDLTARVGWAYDYTNPSLFYVKGGAAFVLDRIDVATNATPSFIGLAPQIASSSITKLGWTIGAGVEYAIDPGWSVKVEYDYAGFGGGTVATPPGLVQPAPPIPFYFPTPAGTTRVTQNFQDVKLGLNYRFGQDPSARWASESSAFAAQAPVSGWEVEAGARY
jgi:opacity protein-like surface antigen